MPFEQATELSSDEKVKQMGLDDRIKILFSIYDIQQKNNEDDDDFEKRKKQTQNRKERLITLFGNYHQSLLRSQPTGEKSISWSDRARKDVHNKIMDIIRSVSLSRNGLSEDQRALFEFLGKDRDEVERLIRYYFTSKDPVKARNLSEYTKIKEQIDFLNRKQGPEEE